MLQDPSDLPWNDPNGLPASQLPWNDPRYLGLPVMVDGFPRRNRLDLYTPAETAIWSAMKAVEEAGAHPLLTDAVMLLQQARDKVADYVDLNSNEHIKSQQTENS